MITSDQITPLTAAEIYAVSGSLNRAHYDEGLGLAVGGLGISEAGIGIPISIIGLGLMVYSMTAE